MAETEQAPKDKKPAHNNGVAKDKPIADVQMMSPKVDKIVAALIKVQLSLNPVPKTKRVTISQSQSYSYASLEACFAEALPKLNANGIALTQTLWPDETGGTKLWSLLLHTSGQWIASQHPIKPEGRNAFHAIASAITYARRYTFCPQVGLATEEDDDAGAAIAASPNTVAQPRPDKRYAARR